MIHSRLKIFASCAALIFLAASCQRRLSPAPAVAEHAGAYNLSVGGRLLRVQLALTPAQQQQGLSGRTSMAGDEGMLFDFDGEVYPSFWMKQMNFPLDLIWIDGGKIAGITPNVPAPAAGTPDSELPLYFPPVQVRQVLEVNAGWTKNNSIAIGDAVVLLDDKR